MNKSNHRSPFAIVGRLIVLVKPMLPIMLAAIVMGVAGHFCATFITIFGGLGILRALGLASPVRTRGHGLCLHSGICPAARHPALCRAGFQPLYRFQAAGLIRDQVFGALRRLTPGQAGGP